MIKTDVIEQQFKDVIEFSQGFRPKTTKLFENWYVNKKPFIEMFGNQLIYEVPTKLQFSLNENIKRRKMSEFISEIRRRYHNIPLNRFLDQLTVEEFYGNKLEKPYEDSGIALSTGNKVVKAFKYFEENSAILEKIQQEASAIIQEDKIEGILCFSVHPLDYLSSSENGCGWRSCHSLDGEFRAGNLSYMTDESTVVCYLKEEKEKKLPNFPSDVPWNSKKWRVLLHISLANGFMFAGRQYPFSDESYLDIVRLYLRKAFPQFAHCSFWSNLYHTALGPIPLNYNYFMSNRCLYPKELVIEDVYAGDSPLHYNDLLRSSVYIKPYYCDFWYSSYEMNKHKEMKLKIGNKVPCLYCEKEYIEDSELMVCVDCESTAYRQFDAFCDCCNNGMYYEDTLYQLENEQLICEACFNEFAVACSRCGHYIYTENGVVVPNNKQEMEYMCACCAKEEEKEYGNQG